MIQENAVLKIRRKINAPAEWLFDAWTQPELIKQWFHADPTWTTPEAQTDLRTGGAWRLEMVTPDGKPHPCFGKYKILDRPNQLVLTWHLYGEEDYETTLTLLFQTVPDGAVELTLTQEGLRNERDATNYRDGWTGCLRCLESLAGAL